MKLPLFVCLMTLCASSALAEEKLGYRGAEKGSGAAAYEKALAALRRNRSTTIKAKKGWIVATSRDGLDTWTFTPSGHYAHPSFARRKMVRAGDAWNLKTTMSCGATKSLCDRLMREYLELDRRMKADIDAHRGQ